MRRSPSLLSRCVTPGKTGLFFHWQAAVIVSKVSLVEHTLPQF